MSTLSRLAAGAALVVGAVLASSALAADPPGGGGGGGHFSGGGRGGGMPPHGFHGAPPSFHGGPGHGPGPGPGAGHYGLGRAGHDLGAFHGHDFRHFTPEERQMWMGGAWRHERHNGYLGWWWVVGDDWFFYPGPIYPYPLYVGPDYYYDYYSYYPAPPYYWYHCEDPLGYYPQVQQCNGPWEEVPPAN